MSTVTIYRDFAQRSDDWYAARRGMVTASTIGQLVTVGAPGADAYDCPACTALIGTPCVSLRNGEPIKTTHPARDMTAHANDLSGKPRPRNIDHEDAQ